MLIRAVERTHLLHLLVIIFRGVPIDGTITYADLKAATGLTSTYLRPLLYAAFKELRGEATFSTVRHVGYVRLPPLD